MSNKSRSNFETIDQITKVTQVTECGWQFQFATDRTPEIVGFKTNINIAEILATCLEVCPTVTVDEFIAYCAMIALSTYETRKSFIDKLTNDPSWYANEDD